MAGSGANGAQMLRCWDHPLNKEDLWRPLSARGRSVRDHCRLVQSSRLKTPSLKENPRPIRGAKALQQLYDLEPKTCCSSPEPRDLAQEVLTVAENWPVDEDGISPELDPGSAGVNLGLDAKDRFYGRMSGVEVEKELIRLAVLLQSLLRDFGLMKDTFGHLQDEQHSVKELMLQNSSACTAQVVDLQKEVEDKMKSLSAQVVDGNWTVAQCQKDTSAKCQVLREELDGKLESHKHNFQDFREEAGKRFDFSSQSLEEGLQRLTERIDCNEQARKALRIDAFNEMAHARQAAHDLRQSDQEQMKKKFSAMQAVQESMQQACCTVEGKVDAALEALQDVQEKIVIVSEENVSKFVLAENAVAEVQQKVNELQEETTRRRLATQVVIDELQKELLAVKQAGSSLLTSEFSRDESQPGHVAGLADFQVSHVSRVSSEIPTLTQSSNEDRLDVLELQVQRAAENQKILEEEFFERLKEFELQAQLRLDVSQRLDYFDHQVHLAAQSQHSLAEDVFKRLDELEQQVHSSYNQELLELLENLEIQVRQGGERQEELESEVQQLQENFGVSRRIQHGAQEPDRTPLEQSVEERVVEDRDAQEELGETPIDLTDEDESERSPPQRSAEESDRTPTDRSAMEERVVEDRDAQEEPGETPIDLTDEESPARPSESSLTEDESERSPAKQSAEEQESVHDPSGKPAAKDSERIPKQLLAKQEPLQPRVQVVSPKVGALPPLARGISGEASSLTPSSPAMPRLPPRPLSASSAKSASQESQSSGIHPEMQKLISRLSVGSGSSQAPMASRSSSDSNLQKTESLAVTASRMLADALHLFSGDLQRAADNLSRHPSKEALPSASTEPSPSPESSQLRRRSSEPSVSAQMLQLQPSASRDLGGREIAAAQDPPQSPVMATMSRQYSPQSPVMATMSRQYSPQSPVMATMSRQYSPQSPAMSRQPSTGSSVLSFGPGKSFGGSQAVPEQALQSPMSRQPSESSDSRMVGRPSGPGRSFGAGSQAAPEQAAEAPTSGLLPLSTVQQLVSSDYLVLPSEEEEGLARQLALLTELGKEKAAQLGEKFKEEMPKTSKPGSPASAVPRELFSSQTASAGSPKAAAGIAGIAGPRPRDLGKASQEQKPEPQAAARGHEAEGDPIATEMASPETAEMDQQSPSLGVDPDAAAATFAGFLGPQGEESPHPLTDPVAGAQGPIAPMALDEESSLSDSDFLN